MIKNYILCVILFLSHICPAYASGIPVYDASGFVQMVTQLDQMAKDYQKQLEQLEQAVKQANAMTGTRIMGTLSNSPHDVDLRRYLPNTWQETLHMMNAKNLGATALGTQSIYNDLITAYKPVSGATMMGTDPSGTISQAFDRRSNTTYTAMAAGEQSYNNAVTRIDTYEGLLKELDKTTDLKASVDLQSRISAENGMVLNELIRLNAIQMQQKATEDNEGITNATRANTANRYDAKKTAEIFKVRNKKCV